MIALILGIIFVAFTVFACLPMGLNFGPDIIQFLKGASPVIAAFIGLISIFVGIADIRDKNEAKKEELEAQKSEEVK